MPAISMFYGIIVYIYYFDNRKHNRPHIHAYFGEYEAVIAIDDGEVLSGDFPGKKMKLIQAWIEIHQDELLANWKLAINGEHLFKIEPLK
jgi:hypothetical protein